MEDDQEQRPESLLPYDDWTERALRQVVAQAIAFAVDKGLPGAHHFYLTFRTDHPGVVIPERLKAQYKQEMTIVLQHQFWELQMDTAAQVIRVGLSFGGVPAKLEIPLNAVVAFADPHVRFGLRFRPIQEETPVAASESAGQPEADTPEPPQTDSPQTDSPQTDSPQTDSLQPGSPQVVSLDAFRRRSPPRS
jgi:hypothetical protein